MTTHETIFPFGDDDQRPVEGCNLCGGRRFVRIARHDRYRIPVCTVLCETCGLIFLDPQPTAEAYRRFYRDAYRPLVEMYTGNAGDPAALEPRQRLYAEALDRYQIAPHLRGGEKTLLDIGASTGVIAEHFVRRYDLEALCIEPAPTEAAAARARGLETLETLVEDFDPGDRRFDLILLCQSIDHLLDVAGVLSRIHGWLADDGLFFVDALDFRAVLRSKHRLSAALHIDHPYYLVGETMQRYLARAGFEIVSTDVSSIFHLDYLCRKTTPTDQAPRPEIAAALLDEVRLVQATHHLAAAGRGSTAGTSRLRRLLAWRRRR